MWLPENVRHMLGHLQRPAKAIGSLSTVFAGGYELSMWVPGTELGSFENQEVFLIAKPPLWPPHLFFQLNSVYPIELDFFSSG